MSFDVDRAEARAAASVLRAFLEQQLADSSLSKPVREHIIVHVGMLTKCIAWIQLKEVETEYEQRLAESAGTL